MAEKGFSDLELQAMVMRHEGRRRKPYHCSEGFLTIGVGHNIESRPLPAVMGFIALRDAAGDLMT